MDPATTEQAITVTPGGRDFTASWHRDGTLLQLGEVARVVDGFEDSETFSSFDGSPAALVKVYMVGEEGALAVAEAAKKYVGELGEQLPAGVVTCYCAERLHLRRYEKRACCDKKKLR